MQIWAQKLVPQHLISRWVGKLASCRIQWVKDFLIHIFIRHYKVDMSEAERGDYHDYDHFNDFFTRLLKPGQRSMPADLSAIACPCDGEISELGAIYKGRLLQAKGHHYSVQALLGGNEALAREFQNGAFFTAYLSPKDYHRVHMPVAGRLRKMIYVPGSLFSVNHQTVAGVPNLFARNERVIAIYDTDKGPMAMVMVAAIIVAGVVTSWHGVVAPSKGGQIQEWSYENKSIALNRGDEMGYFNLGSTVVMLFGEGQIEWDSSLKSKDYIKLGQQIGRVLPPL